MYMDVLGTLQVTIINIETQAFSVWSFSCLVQSQDQIDKFKIDILMV